MKLESKSYNLFLDAKEIEKHLEELEEAYDNAETAEEARKASWHLESALALVEALREADKELEYLIQEGVVEG